LILINKQYFQLVFRGWVGNTEKCLENCSDCDWSPDRCLKPTGYRSRGRTHRLRR